MGKKETKGTEKHTKPLAPRVVAPAAQSRATAPPCTLSARWGEDGGTLRAFCLTHWAQLLLNALSFRALTLVLETRCFL